MNLDDLSKTDISYGSSRDSRLLMPDQRITLKNQPGVDRLSTLSRIHNMGYSDPAMRDTTFVQNNTEIQTAVTPGAVRKMFTPEEELNREKKRQEDLEEE